MISEPIFSSEIPGSGNGSLQIYSSENADEQLIEENRDDFADPSLCGTSEDDWADNSKSVELNNSSLSLKNPLNDLLTDPLEGDQVGWEVCKPLNQGDYAITSMMVHCLTEEKFVVKEFKLENVENKVVTSI